MNKNLIILGIAVLLFCVGLSGCNESTVSVNRKSANNINMFQCATEGENIRFYFILEDIDGQNTVCDGEVDFQIIDDLDNVLYSDDFNVWESEFIDYGFQLTGTHIGKAYEWRVPVEDIEKGFSIIGFGTATLSFTNTNGKMLTAQTELVKIPTYTEEEIKDIYEGEYESNSTSIHKKISKGNFEIIVAKVGFFNKYDWGVAKRYFRVDMEVKNIGSESDYFLPSGLVIIDSQNTQYEHNYLGTLETYSTVYPGVTKKGYLLFGGVPESETSFRLLFELGYDENFGSYLFEYFIDL